MDPGLGLVALQLIKLKVDSVKENMMRIRKTLQRHYVGLSLENQALPLFPDPLKLTVNLLFYC